MTAEPDLLPCPGCNGASVRVIGGSGTKGVPQYWAGCDRCRWRTWGNTEADAIAAWNTRATAARDAEIEALRAEVNRFRALEAEAAEFVEVPIINRTKFTGDEPYVGWRGLGQSLNEALDERDALRAEVREAREFRDKMANAIGSDQLRRFIEKHGEPVPLTIRMQEAEARAERLAEALEEIRSRCTMNLAMQPDPCALTARLGDIYQIADAALAKEDRND